MLTASTFVDAIIFDIAKRYYTRKKRRQLAARKKALYLEYRKAQQDMRELVAVKGSVDHLRGLTDNQRNKEQAR